MLIGDSRAGLVERQMRRDRYNVAAHISIPGATTGSFKYQSFEQLPEDTELILIFLYQCDFTKKEGQLIKPNPDVNIYQLVEDSEFITAKLKARCPNAAVFWTIPVVRKFTSQEIRCRQETYDMCASIRRLIPMLKDRKIPFLDLAVPFKTGEFREPHDKKYLVDGVHPTIAGTLVLFSHFKIVMMKSGVAKKVISRNT